MTEDDPTPDLLLFLPSLRGGGAERVMTQIAAQCVRRGLRVSMALGEATGPYLAEVDPEVRIVDLHSPRTSRSVLALHRLLRRTTPRAILSTLPHANVAMAIAHRLAASPARLVLREPLDVGKLVRTPAGRSERVLPRLMRCAYPRADAIISVSGGVARSLEEHVGIPAGKIHTIPNPVDVERVRQRAGADGASGVADPGATEPRLVAMGRLAPQKDYPTLLRAFARLRRARAARLIILGEGEERGRLETLTRELDLGSSVEFRGFVANPYPLLATARLYVSSSAWEGMPNALLEALALGVPAVVTDCPSGPSELLDGGRYGGLVPVGDDTALAHAMEQALDTEADPATLRARADAHAPERLLPRYLEVLGLGEGPGDTHP